MDAHKGKEDPRSQTYEAHKPRGGEISHNRAEFQIHVFADFRFNTA
jgi:hypothetical protein